MEQPQSLRSAQTCTGCPTGRSDAQTLTGHGDVNLITRRDAHLLGQSFRQGQLQFTRDFGHSLL